MNSRLQRQSFPAELGEFWEEGFRTPTIWSSRSQSKLLAQFKAILIVSATPFQGTLQRVIYFSHDKMKWGLCFSISYRLHFPTKTFKLFLHVSSITAGSSRDFSWCSHILPMESSAKQTILPPRLLTLPDNDPALSLMTAVFQDI